MPFNFEEWLNECLKKMKMISAYSTHENYLCMLNKWVAPKWKGLDLLKINTNHIYTLIYEDLNQKLSPNTKKTILKMVRKIFQMAVDQGILERNPCNGIQVKVPEIEQSVLTNTEVEIFLQEARHANHRFFPHWFLALTTGQDQVSLWHSVGQILILMQTSFQFLNNGIIRLDLELLKLNELELSLYQMIF